MQAVNETNADPVFQQEQEHLSATYATLQRLGRNLVRQMEHAAREAAADKKSMAEELAPNLATYADAMETYADFAAMNRIIDGYNLAHDARTEELGRVELLLRQPYFAKVVLQFKPGEPAKEIYLGNAGLVDESYHRIVVDWRSPIAEVYYNQDTGPTSYCANGRIISVDLKLRRQFDIEESRLNAYFDTNVAIQDSLLLASLTRERTAHMQAITATIQKEQNVVVRHADVPALLVSGIAGSGKTSVLLQRIAYLFYQHRESLDAREVFLITPNPVFRSYIEEVLPDLGEANPRILTWDEFARNLLPKGQGMGAASTELAAFERIDEVVATCAFEFEPGDFRDVSCNGTRLITADQVRKVSDKFRRIPAGPHRVTLMREELLARLDTRLAQMAGTEEAADELSTLGIDEQLRIFHETIAPQTEQEERALALRYLRDRYEGAFTAVERDDWLRVDRIGMRLLGAPGLAPLEWLYLKMALTGLSDPHAKYVMIDEMQDYTVAQLAVLARYFRRAHFLLLGDPNQAIVQGTASTEEVRTIFRTAYGNVEECRLMTSYRSTPEITNLFASLLSDTEHMRVSTVQRAEVPPVVVECPTSEEWEAALRQAVASAQAQGQGQRRGLTAIITPHKRAAKLLVQALEMDACQEANPNASASSNACDTLDSPMSPSACEALASPSAPSLPSAPAPFNACDASATSGASDTSSSPGPSSSPDTSNSPALPSVAFIDEGDELPSFGIVLITLKLAKGLEFDHVIVPDASAHAFPENDLSRRRLYTTLSRATRRITLLTQGKLTPLLAKWRNENAPAN